MDSSIQPVAPGPHAPDPLRRRQGGNPFDLERELERSEHERERESDDDAAPREPTPVAPPDEDEAGTHLDLTA